jgi:hypothetical protein
VWTLGALLDMIEGPQGAGGIGQDLEDKEINIVGQDSLVDKALDYRPKGTGFDPRLDHKRCLT